MCTSIDDDDKGSSSTATGMTRDGMGWDWEMELICIARKSDGFIGDIQELSNAGGLHEPNGFMNILWSFCFI